MYVSGAGSKLEVDDVDDIVDSRFCYCIEGIIRHLVYIFQFFEAFSDVRA